MSQAEFSFTLPQVPAPAGTFLLPVCTDIDGLLGILNALHTYRVMAEDDDMRGYQDVLEALAYLNNPAGAPCVDAPCDDEDNQADNLIQLVDGIIENLKEGGIETAFGYLIDNLGRVIFNTALNVIATTVIAGAIGGLVTVIVGGVAVGTIAVAANEIAEIIVQTGASPTNIIPIEFIYEVAA